MAALSDAEFERQLAALLEREPPFAVSERALDAGTEAVSHQSWCAEFNQFVNLQCSDAQAARALTVYRTTRSPAIALARTHLSWWPTAARWVILVLLALFWLLIVSRLR